MQRTICLAVDLFNLVSGGSSNVVISAWFQVVTLMVNPGGREGGLSGGPNAAKHLSGGSYVV